MGKNEIRMLLYLNDSLEKNGANVEAREKRKLIF